jgi:hypothetical protein
MYMRKIQTYSLTFVRKQFSAKLKEFGFKFEKKKFPKLKERMDLEYSD